MNDELSANELFQRARQKAAEDEDLLDCLQWIEILMSVGVSATQASNVWSQKQQPRRTVGIPMLN